MADWGVISNWHNLIDTFNTSTLDFYAAVEKAVTNREVPEVAFSRLDVAEGGLASASREYLRVKRGRVAFDICAAPYGNGFFFSWWLVRVGPEHPLLWALLFLFGFLVWVWILVALGGQAVTQSLMGGGGDSGCSFILLLLGGPALLIFFGHAIHKGYLDIDEGDVLAIPVVGWLYEKFFNPVTYYSLDTALMFQESVRRAVNEVIQGLLDEQGLRALSPDQLQPTIRDLAR